MSLNAKFLKRDIAILKIVHIFVKNETMKTTKIHSYQAFIVVVFFLFVPVGFRRYFAGTELQITSPWYFFFIKFNDIFFDFRLRKEIKAIRKNS